MDYFSILITFLFTIGVLALIRWFIRLNQSTESLSEKPIEEIFPYQKKSYLMTNAERNFFKVLHEAVGEKYYIVPQVPLSNIVEVQYPHKREYKYRNKINRRYLDFVLFDREYFTPQIVIELDDKTHELPDRIIRDSFVDKVLKTAGIRIEHIKNNHSYAIKSLIN